MLETPYGNFELWRQRESRISRMSSDDYETLVAAVGRVVPTTHGEECIVFDPFSEQRLQVSVSGMCLAAFAVREGWLALSTFTTGLGFPPGFGLAGPVGRSLSPEACSGCRPVGAMVVVVEERVELWLLRLRHTHTGVWLRQTTGLVGSVMTRVVCRETASGLCYDSSRETLARK